MPDVRCKSTASHLPSASAERAAAPLLRRLPWDRSAVAGLLLRWCCGPAGAQTKIYFIAQAAPQPGCGDGAAGVLRSARSTA
jgi:hypothetical protein